MTYPESHWNYRIVKLPVDPALIESDGEFYYQLCEVHYRNLEPYAYSPATFHGDSKHITLTMVEHALTEAKKHPEIVKWAFSLQSPDGPSPTP